MKKHLLYLLIFSLLIPSIAWSQNSNSQLAYRYYRDKEYEAAASIFNELYQTSKSKSYFSYYISSLLKLENYSKAEKAVKKEIRRYPEDLIFQVELGYIYKIAGEVEKSKKQYKKTIGRIIPVKREFITVANAFRGKAEHQLAIETYEKGRKVLKQKHLFHFEIANILLSQRNFNRMLDEYIIALSVTPSKRQQIQNQIQSALSQNINSNLNKLLKSKLLFQIQNKKDNLVYKELLLWYYIQKKQFTLAFTQAQSIDLIKNNEGEKLIYLAHAANSNQDYLTAQNCFKMVINKGRKSKYYTAARLGELENNHLKLENKYNVTISEWKLLSEKYTAYFKDPSNKNQSFKTLIRFARLTALRLNDTKTALGILKASLKSRNIKHNDKAKMKLALADITLLANRKWDAILLYSQIEKNYKNNPIGYEAKLKKAKVSYYLGEFDWAKAQLDVLKGSTSKLIANDALELSQLISDNTSLDSSFSAMKSYAEAEFLIYQGKTNLALLKLNAFYKTFPGHSLSDEVHYKTYEIYSSKHLYTKAINELESIVTDHPYENLAAKALFKQAELFKLSGNKEKSGANYKKIVIDYPESIYSVEARNRFSVIRTSASQKTSK